jgi:hypothetical protein
MKRIILSVMVLAFAVAVQAGDAKTCPLKNSDKPACCADKAKMSTGTKGCCPFAKAACCKSASAKQTVLRSPKDSDTAR